MLFVLVLVSSVLCINQAFIDALKTVNEHGYGDFINMLGILKLN